MKISKIKSLFLAEAGETLDNAFPCGEKRHFLSIKKAKQKEYDVRWENPAESCYERVFLEFDFCADQGALLSIQLAVSADSGCHIPGSFLDFSSDLFQGEFELGDIEGWQAFDSWIDLGKNYETVRERSGAIAVFLRNRVAPCLTAKSKAITSGQLVDDLTNRLPIILKNAYDRDSDVRDLLTGSERWVETMKKYSIINSSAVERYAHTVEEMKCTYLTKQQK